MKMEFFKSPAEFRKWLEKNHARATELWVGFYKRDSGNPSMTWPESVDQALSFGWIDGVRKNVDEISYTIRFTPRKARSIWSSVNIKRVAALSKLGLMQSSGLKVFNQRDRKKSKLYSYEAKIQKLDALSERKFRANTKAWEFFRSQAPSYQKVACRWVMSAKQESTKSKRLTTLIKDSQSAKRLAFTTKWSKK